MSDAIQLFRAFHGRNPSANEIVEIKQDKPQECLAVGSAYGIMYKVPGVKEPYLHKFKLTARPRLFVSGDGRQIYLINGVYRFTDRGFVG